MCHLLNTDLLAREAARQRAYDLRQQHAGATALMRVLNELPGLPSAVRVAGMQHLEQLNVAGARP